MLRNVVVAVFAGIAVALDAEKKDVDVASGATYSVDSKKSGQIDK